MPKYSTIRKVIQRGYEDSRDGRECPYERNPHNRAHGISNWAWRAWHDGRDKYLKEKKEQ